MESRDVCSKKTAVVLNDAIDITTLQEGYKKNILN